MLSRNHCRELFQMQRSSNKAPKPSSLSNYLIEAGVNTWGPFESSNLFILSAIIQRFHDPNVLREKFPIGLSREQANVMNEIESGIRYLRPSKGSHYYVTDIFNTDREL